MNIDMAGLRWFFNHLCVLVLWTKVASVMEGLRRLVQGLVRAVVLAVCRDVGSISFFPLWRNNEDDWIQS